MTFLSVGKKPIQKIGKALGGLRSGGGGGSNKKKSKNSASSNDKTACSSSSSSNKRSSGGGLLERISEECANSSSMPEFLESSGRTFSEGTSRTEEDLVSPVWNNTDMTSIRQKPPCRQDSWLFLSNDDHPPASNEQEQEDEHQQHRQGEEDQPRRPHHISDTKGEEEQPVEAAEELSVDGGLSSAPLPPYCEPSRGPPPRSSSSLSKEESCRAPLLDRVDSWLYMTTTVHDEDTTTRRHAKASRRPRQSSRESKRRSAA